MADREDYERIKERILAIPDEKEKKLGIPVAALSQEAEMLYNWVQDDEEKFSGAKFDWNMVKSLPARTGAARYTEAVTVKGTPAPSRGTLMRKRGEALQSKGATAPKTGAPVLKTE